MRSIFLCLFLCSTSIVFSQEETPSVKNSLKQSSTQNDPVIEKMQRATDSSAKSIEMKQWEERNIKAMLEISAQVEKNRAKEKRNAYLCIGFGVALLVVLIIGLMRKRAKK